MRVWRMSLRRTKGAILSWAGSVCLFFFFNLCIICTHQTNKQPTHVKKLSYDNYRLISHTLDIKSHICMNDILQNIGYHFINYLYKQSIGIAYIRIMLEWRLFGRTCNHSRPIDSAYGYVRLSARIGEFQCIPNRTFGPTLSSFAYREPVTPNHTPNHYSGSWWCTMVTL